MIEKLSSAECAPLDKIALTAKINEMIEVINKQTQELERVKIHYQLLEP